MKERYADPTWRDTHRNVVRGLQDLLPAPANWWLWWAVATFIPIVANYLMFDVIESKYSIILLGERMAAIEEEVNSALLRRVLIWESNVVASFWSKLHARYKIINPDWFLSAFGAMVAVAIAVLVPGFLYWNLWHVDHSGWLRITLIITGATLTILSVALTLYVGKSVTLDMPGKPRQIFRALLNNQKAAHKVSANTNAREG